MNTKQFFKSLSLCALLLSVIPACTDNTKRESTGEYLDSTVLTTKIKSTFLGDSRLKMLDINVKTYKGIVDLSGFVDNQAQADRAVQLSRTIKGVKEVHNSLIVK